ncbi:uncharacterized protein [Nicotiana tomentosiformis]|uniref:uncharacterized protein n=1 Tax=Nicotiana tomentosiformis TaxID=4098 RepID=UPI00388C8FDC
MVADALSRKAKSLGRLVYLPVAEKPLALDVQALANQFRKFDAVWVIVDRLTKSAHFIPAVTTYSSEQLVQVYIHDIVRLHGMPISIISNQAQSKQKSYADRKVYAVTFMVGERVLLQVLPMKGVIRFGKKGKLSPWYIGPFEILERIEEVAYKLALPPSLDAVHPEFHVSMLLKYHDDPSHMLDFSSIQLDKDPSYVEEPLAILDR